LTGNWGITYPNHSPNEVPNIEYIFNIRASFPEQLRNPNIQLTEVAEEGGIYVEFKTIKRWEINI
jgi:hypothetical protein